MRLPFSALVGNTQVRNLAQNAVISIDENLKLPHEAAKDITETVIENAVLLGTDIPPIKRYWKSGITNDGSTHAAGLQTSIFPFIKPKIAVTPEYAEDITTAYNHSEESKRKMKKHLRVTFAEEMAHLYVHKNYPRVSERGILANRVGGQAYSNDTGEKFSKKFASSYAKCKESLSK